MKLSKNHISVNRGEIKSLSNSEHVNRFKEYFESVEFEKFSLFYYEFYNSEKILFKLDDNSKYLFVILLISFS